MKYPFKQKKNNGLLIREFSKDVDSGDLVWHRDRKDRPVTVLEGAGWCLQMDNRLPKPLVPGKTYYIPMNTYHRVIKGETNLVVEIKEKSTMKLTMSQLKDIIREASIGSPEDPFMMVVDAVRQLPPNHPVAAGRASSDQISDFVIMTVGDELATPELDARVQKAFRVGGLLHL